MRDKRPISASPIGSKATDLAQHCQMISSKSPFYVAEIRLHLYNASVQTLLHLVKNRQYNTEHQFNCIRFLLQPHFNSVAMLPQLCYNTSTSLSQPICIFLTTLPHPFYISSTARLQFSHDNMKTFLSLSSFQYHHDKALVGSDFMSVVNTEVLPCYNFRLSIGSSVDQYSEFGLC